MTIAATNDAAAGALFQSTIQAAGVDVSHLGQLAQVQLAVANSITGSIPDTVSTLTFTDKLISTTAIATPSAVAATQFTAFASTVSGATLMGFGTTGDVTLKNRAGTDVLVVTSNTVNVTLAGMATLADHLVFGAGSASDPGAGVRFIGMSSSTTSLRYNALTTGSHNFRVNGTTQISIGASVTIYGVAGAAYSLAGQTGSGADQASAAFTIKAAIGTGAGAVGGLIFQVPVTHASDSVAQTLTTALSLGTGGSARVQVAVGLGIAKAPTATSTLSISGLPTSASGLVTGDVWSNVGILTIV